MMTVRKQKAMAGKRVGVIAIGMLSLAFLPEIALAASFKQFVSILIGLVETATFLLGTILLLVFFWGIARFIFNASNSQKHAEDKTFLFWSVLCLAVMFSVWGLVEILRVTLI